MKAFLLMASFLCLAGCSGRHGISLAPYQSQTDGPQQFTLCHGFGCTSRTPVSLSDQQWRDITAPLKAKNSSAAQERTRIAEAIARMEREVTKVSGLNPDLGEAHTFEKDQAQMDCLDETINTSRYLEFFAEAGLLKFHAVRNPVHRGFFVDGMWPHNSAAIEDIETRRVYVVDSYYRDNGRNADIVPLEIWVADWRPEEVKEKRARKS